MVMKKESGIKSGVGGDVLRRPRRPGRRPSHEISMASEIGRMKVNRMKMVSMMQRAA